MCSKRYTEQLCIPKSTVDKIDKITYLTVNSIHKVLSFNPPRKGSDKSYIPTHLHAEMSQSSMQMCMYVVYQLHKLPGIYLLFFCTRVSCGEC